MAHKVWHEIEIYNAITEEWELVMKVKSHGLAYHAFELLIKLYGSDNVREN